MPKILFVSTDVHQPIGYAKISAKILNFLAKDPDNDIYHFAFSNFENKRIERHIDPRIKIIDVLKEEKEIGSSELYGVDIICKFMDKIRPDILFIYNDLVVISRLFNVLIDYKINNDFFKVYLYLDLVYDYERYDLIRHINRISDKIFLFTENWKDNLIKMGVDKNKIYVFNHGVDTENIHKMERNKARELLGLKENDTVFLNTNRNSYRKGWDITIEAFIILLKYNNFDEKIKLFINCQINSIDSYNIPDLIKICCIKHNIDFEKVINTHFIIPADRAGILPDPVINAIYNACDVGLNTCVGEGFGLCNLEHAYLGKPQIVSNVGGLKEIFKSGNSVLVNPVASYYIANNIDSHGGYIHICNPQDFANAMNFYFMNSEFRLKHGEEVSKHITEKFSWDGILNQFYKDFKNDKNDNNSELQTILRVYSEKIVE